jgi:superfamily II DNA or RNA helicase
MIDLETAAALIDFGTRIGHGQRSREQLEGAVALHNILSERGVAYLADEVGMGKTYVALGALALFRHYEPDFRVLIIAPRENIQTKWMKELRNFVAHNVRFPDLRTKAVDGRPTRQLIACRNLTELVHEVAIDPDRDFFLRLTSFSLGVSGKGTVDPEAGRRLRDGLRRSLPWIRDEVFDLRYKQEFKDNVARAVCCALPRFDLVIVDEGHNLKHGFGPNVAARNRVLAFAMGREIPAPDPRLFPRYGPRAKRVLFLSATPVEETYRHLWNQLDIFGRGRPFEDLRKQGLEEAAHKAIVRQFLIRRVTSIQADGQDLTKNLYRREWRRGGVHVHDEPIRVEDPRQRLIVGLVQKKVSELLGHERFGTSFQIGMLASFESFLETARVKRDDPDGANFDDSEQTDDVLEREGIDISDVNRLAKSYRSTFDAEMPHPKMDAVVESLSRAWERGEKTLIFVRRVASVKELKRKLDERYDAWLMARLERELPGLRPRLLDIFKRYRADKREADARGELPDPGAPPRQDDDDTNRGDKDTFFAWFFRGDGPRGVVSGANVQQRFIQRGTAYSTFFEDNYVADLLGCRLGEVTQRLAEAINVDPTELRAGLRDRSRRFLSTAKTHARADRLEAAQASAIEWLKEKPGPLQEQARIVWRARFESTGRFRHATEAPDIGNGLEQPTFFTELRKRASLRDHLWPRSNNTDPVLAFREQEIRGQMLSSAARLGHGLIDLYVLTIRRLGSLEARAQESSEGDGSDGDVTPIAEYLDFLEGQMATARDRRDWGAYDELADVATNFNLILDVNEPDAMAKPLSETARVFGRLLRQQQPVGGMSGQVNQTLVQQFRMPGYPLVLVTTDLLQEGEDLHTFCSSVHHYGISWTPSSMEQRIGRIDRVRSQTETRLNAIRGRPLRGEDMLQVYFPHLEDTVEVLQVQRVLERMNIFLRLMHEGLITAGSDERTINTGQEFARGRRLVPPIRERLESAFPVLPGHLECEPRKLAIGPEVAQDLSRRFARLASQGLPGVEVVWEAQTEPGMLLGTARIGNRIQPFSLVLKSMNGWPVVRCVSPVGRVGPGEEQDAVVTSAATVAVRIGAIVTTEERTYDLTAEGDVLLVAGAESDVARVALLVDRVVKQADALERRHLSGRDEVLATFREELTDEGTLGR